MYLELGYNCILYDMRLIEALDSSTVPILFAHGEADATVPPQNARAIRGAKGKRELHYVAGADHAESVLVTPKEYRETIGPFAPSKTPDG